LAPRLHRLLLLLQLLLLLPPPPPLPPPLLPLNENKEVRRYERWHISPRLQTLRQKRPGALSVIRGVRDSLA
jgi:hypothetical protein